MLKTPSKFRQRRGFAGGAMFKGSWGRCLLHTHQVHIFHLSIALKTRNCTNCAPVLCAICWTKGILESPNLCPANQKWGVQQGQACEPQPGTQPVPLTSSCEGRNWMGRYPVCGTEIKAHVQCSKCLTCTRLLQARWAGHGLNLTPVLGTFLCCSHERFHCGLQNPCLQWQQLWHTGVLKDCRRKSKLKALCISSQVHSPYFYSAGRRY